MTYMKPKKEGKRMTNKIFKAIIQMLRTIVIKSKSKEEILKALDEIQSLL